MKNLSVGEFARKTSSSEPVPGGGSISALAGGLSAALAEMVASLTLGSNKYEAVHKDMEVINKKAHDLCEELLDDIQTDSEAFTKVMEAFKLPKTTDEEKSTRSKAIQIAMKGAADVPMSVAEKAFQVMDLSAAVVEKGNKNAVTDGMVSAMMARTAVLGALLNVKINLGSIKDTDYVTAMTKRVDQLEKAAKEKEEQILQSVNL